MKKIAKISLESVAETIDPNRINNSFEIFGLDYMITESYQPLLIEINTNPDIEFCCTLLSKIIPNMVENTLRIAVDPVFPPPDISYCKNNKMYIPNNLV